VQREDARLWCHRGRIRRGRDDEVDVARSQFLQHHRLLSELRTGELIDRELPAGQLLELGVENIRGDAVGRRARLVVAEAERPLGGDIARRREHRDHDERHESDEPGIEPHEPASCETRASAAHHARG